MTERKPDKTNRLLVLSSAAVLGVYSAGYLRTKAAAEKFSDGPPLRRAAVPVAIHGSPSPAPAPPALRPIETPGAEKKPADQLPSEIRSKTAHSPVGTDAAVETAKPAQKPRASESKAPADETLPTPSLGTGPAPLIAMSPAAVLPAAGQLSQLSAVPPAPKWKDGTYSGWGTCRHGDIEATVTVAAGRITSARVSQCYTRYSCSWIDPIVPQVVARQSPETDYVSGATQSTYAFYYAVIEALSKAKP
jgi:uncharacterized protein with FMN-binding domain